MSVPDPKAWEATDRECEELSWPGGAQAVAELVARRRAIAELKALAAESFEMQGCYKFWQAIDVAQIHDRIAAIEAESA